LTQIVEEVSKGEAPYLIVSGSEIKAVLMGITQYNDLMEKLEDGADAREILQARLENEPTMSWKEFLKKTKDQEVMIKRRKGDIFLIVPKETRKRSAFDVPGIKTKINKEEIAEAVRETREAAERDD
jgi:prevent-host-death family protein